MTAKTKTTISLHTTIQQMTEMALMLPLSRSQHTKEFSKLIQQLKITPADERYIKRIDHGNILTEKEIAILTDEARGYILALTMYYELQMATRTDWQQNYQGRITQAEMYAFVTEQTIDSTLVHIGMNDINKIQKEHKHVCRIRQKYIKVKNVDRVYLQDHSFAPVFKEMLLANAGKRMQLTKAKTQLIIKYANKLHSCAKKYHYYINHRCNLVGINFVMESE